MQERSISFNNISYEDKISIAKAISFRISCMLHEHPISQLELNLTDGCNMACDYCFAKSKDNGDHMSWHIGKQSIDLLIEYSKKNRNISITFFGGEPMLMFPLLKEITEYAENKAKETGKKIEFAMTTNATLFTETALKYCHMHRIKLLLSIDGDKLSHDVHRRMRKDPISSHDIVINKLSMIKKYQPWLGSRMTVTPGKVHKLYHNIKYLFNLGINQFIVGRQTGIDWLPESVEIWKRQMLEIYPFWKESRSKKLPFRMTYFEDLLKDRHNGWGCRAGVTCIAISPNGDIYGCSKFIPINGNGKRYLLGNVFSGITEISKMSELSDHTDYPRNYCSECSYKKRCAGGCIADNLESTGSIFRPDHNTCLFVKADAQVADTIKCITKNSNIVEMNSVVHTVSK